VKPNRNSTARTTWSSTPWICAIDAETSIAVMFGKSRLIALSKPGRLGGAKGGDVAHRRVGHARGREQDEEVDPHRRPVDLAQAGDLAFHRLAAHVEAQGVAELQAERRRQALLDAEAARLVRRPLALRDGVVRRQLDAVAEVELAVDEAARPVVGELVGDDGLAVDRDEPAADHREPVVAGRRPRPPASAERLGLRRLDVDDEAVRRVLRRRLAPARDQVGAQQGEQHQREQADRERRDLEHGERRARRDLPRRQHEPARRARPRAPSGAAAPSASHDRSANTQDRAGEAADRDQAELQVARHREQQRGEADRAGGEHRDRRRLERADVAADHAQAAAPRASCSTGGTPKPNSSVKPTPAPNSAGQALGGGSAASTRPERNQMKT
jgi:hypothetical protein